MVVISNGDLGRLRKHALNLIISIVDVIDLVGAMPENAGPKELSALAELDSRVNAIKARMTEGKGSKARDGESIVDAHARFVAASDEFGGLTEAVAQTGGDWR